MRNIKTILLAMALITSVGCSNEPPYPTDTFIAQGGEEYNFHLSRKAKVSIGVELPTFSITFFKHASLAININDKYIYIDPLCAYATFANLPKADLILVTHSHYDHLDLAAIDSLSTPTTTILCDSTSASQLTRPSVVMRPGDHSSPRDYVQIEAIAAYNTSEGHLQFHPRERQDCGYILTILGRRIYIAGDSEPTPEMLALKNIDIAFLPVNQPYTMTVDQAIEVVKTIRPATFYPYHYGQVEEKTDIDRLTRELKDVCEVRIRPME